MNAPAASAIDLPAIGAAMPGGRFVGAILLPDGPWGLVKAPKAALDLGRIAWHDKYTDIDGAKSPVDGPANTRAMADAGSKLARQILDFKHEDLRDFYLPAQDELEVIYRNCKPTDDGNSDWYRSGINLHAFPTPTPPYTFAPAKQTEVEIFRAGGAEAFATDEPYWTSTQHAGYSYCAWDQWFNDGSQGRWDKDSKCRVCLVRRLPI